MTSWLSPDDVAALQPREVTSRAIQIRVQSGKYGSEGKGWRRVTSGRNASAIEISPESLSLEEKARLLAARCGRLHLVSEEEQAEPRSRAFAFQNANDVAKKRATLRKAAIDIYQAKLAAWGTRPGLTAYKSQVAEQIKQELPDLGKASRWSLDLWVSEYQAYGLDGLVDSYERCGRRPSLPPRVQQFFIARYTDGTIPTRAQAIAETRFFAHSELKLDLTHVADDAFDRVLATIPQAVLLSSRGEQDDEEKVIYTLRRDHVFPALHMVVADHHISDRWVHCSGRVCGPQGCEVGHRVWITAFMDVASRTVLAWTASLNYPSSDTICRTLRQLIEKWGLPNGIYVDNGKDFKSAFGRAIQKKQALPINANALSNLLTALGVKVTFAIPRNARAKSIERLFGTWVRQIWQGHPAYTGALGKRTEAAEKLRKQPEQLITLEEFQQELETVIEAYNVQPGHRGQGMNGRSPLEVLTASRIERRAPEPAGFALAFHRWYGRQVRAGGTVEVGEDRYILDPIVAAGVIGKRVQLLVNPDDVRRAVVVTGCKHTTFRRKREASLLCECRGKGQFLCEATHEALSSYVDAPIASEHIRAARRINKELRRQIREFSSTTARRDLRVFKANRGQMLAAIAEATRTEQARIAAAVGDGTTPASTPVLLPQSLIARNLDQYRKAVTPRSPLTPEQRELARQADDEAPIDAPPLRLVTPTRASLMRERAAHGYCQANETCPNPGAPKYCHQHQELLDD